MLVQLLPATLLVAQGHTRLEVPRHALRYQQGTTLMLDLQLPVTLHACPDRIRLEGRCRARPCLLGTTPLSHRQQQDTLVVLRARIPQVALHHAPTAVLAIFLHLQQVHARLVRPGHTRVLPRLAARHALLENGQVQFHHLVQTAMLVHFQL